MCERLQSKQKENPEQCLSLVIKIFERDFTEGGYQMLKIHLIVS